MNGIILGSRAKQILVSINKSYPFELRGAVQSFLKVCLFISLSHSRLHLCFLPFLNSCSLSLMFLVFLSSCSIGYESAIHERRFCV